MDQDAAFWQTHPLVPWRGMRNRIAHGYFEINFEVVWETVRTALPALLEQLPAVRAAVDNEATDGNERVKPMR